MLKPAILFKEKLEKLFAAEIYTEKYFYYCGYGYDFELPVIEAQSNNYQWAITEPIDNFTDKVIGYLAYRINPTTDDVYNFGLYSFDEGNQTVIRDTFEKLEELVKEHHRVEWRVIDGNHAKRGYDAFCKKHNGNSVCLHDVTKDLPLNRQEVLVSIGEFVSEDVFDEDFYNFENNDIENVDAWMPKPKSYKADKEWNINEKGRTYRRI